MGSDFASSDGIILTELITFANTVRNPTNGGFAIAYANCGLRIIPCPHGQKIPLVDHGLGFSHGLIDATRDLRAIARAWHKYPDAGIAWSLPDGIIVIDCDVLKDQNKRPILNHNKEINPIGLNSFNEIILERSLGEAGINTLRTKTQSGGYQFFYRLTTEQRRVLEKEGKEITNHTGIFDHVDIKTKGGYVLLPPSSGPYGKYEFASMREISDLPDWLFGVLKEKFEPSRAGTSHVVEEAGSIDSEGVLTVVDLLLPYWSRADGRRNDLTLAIDGSLARMGISIEQRRAIISELCRRSGKGCDHINAVGYSDKKLKEGLKIKGFGSLEKLIDELEGGRAQ